MNKTKSFLSGIMLIVIVFATLFFAVLLYNTVGQLSIHTYIFQMSNNPEQRVGPMQSMNDMTPDELRNKLIHKYVSEYFKVIPTQDNSKNGSVQQFTIRKLSTLDVYNKWYNGEATTIAKMAQQNMFRRIIVDRIVPTDDSNWFEVKYTAQTWEESNNMDTNVIESHGTVLLRVRFEKDFLPAINIKQSLKNGDNPALLFRFRVSDIRINRGGL